MEELQVPERYMYINIIVYILYWRGYMPPAPNVLHVNVLHGLKLWGRFHHTIFGIADVT